MNISYEGIGYLAMTVPAGDCSVGRVCCLNASGYADDCYEGAYILGIVEAIKGDCATVQVEGVTKLSYTGPVPQVGVRKLMANGYGGVKTSTEGKEYLVLANDQENNTITVKL